VFVDGERYPKKASVFCNPYKIAKDNTRDDVTNLFREYIMKKLEEDSSLKSLLCSYKGKTLGCWCSPERCHGDILVELIEEYTKE
jgi:hypothetical protein